MEEATTVVSNHYHNDAESDPTVPTLVPTYPVVDGGEPAPTEDVEKVTTIAPNDPAPTQEIEEATTLVPNDSHNDAEPDPTAPKLVPTYPVVDEGEPAPFKDVEEVTTLASNESTGSYGSSVGLSAIFSVRSSVSLAMIHQI